MFVGGIFPDKGGALDLDNPQRQWNGQGAGWQINGQLANPPSGARLVLRDGNGYYDWGQKGWVINEGNPYNYQPQAGTAPVHYAAPAGGAANLSTAPMVPVSGGLLAELAPALGDAAIFFLAPPVAKDLTADEFTDATNELDYLHDLAVYKRNLAWWSIIGEAIGVFLARNPSLQLSGTMLRRSGIRGWVRLLGDAIANLLPIPDPPGPALSATTAAAAASGLGSDPNINRQLRLAYTASLIDLERNQGEVMSVGHLVDVLEKANSSGRLQLAA